MIIRTTHQSSLTPSKARAILVIAIALGLAAIHAAAATACAAVDAAPTPTPATRPSTGPAAAADAQRYTFQRRTRDGIGKVYMGREIAQVMGHLAAGWLERPEREREEQPRKAIELMALRPSDVVADI